MERGVPRHLTAAETENLLEVLLRQYILHEIKHHPPLETKPLKALKVRTLAIHMPDIYKLLHQGTFGYWQHIPSKEYFRKHLADDWESVAPGEGEPVLESVTHDNAIVRVNLRPYKALFPGEEDRAVLMLEKLVLDSENIKKDNPAYFFSAMSAFREINRQAALVIGKRRYVIPPADVEQFFGEVKHFITHHEVLPLFSHSPGYHQLNRPAYVIADTVVLEGSPLAFLLEETIA
ncbi:MAG: hypothetical protein LJE96_16260 [Deltaproteobacteria bacterium]|nr:hypothetical protein [Deltaproteobacteria bacterium]